MSYVSDLRTPITIIEPKFGKDPEGFPTYSETIQAETLCRMEVKNATEKWTQRADLKDASAVLTFRTIPGVTVTRFMLVQIGDDLYEILNVEDVRGRGMYTQIIVRLKDEGDA